MHEVGLLKGVLLGIFMVASPCVVAADASAQALTLRAVGPHVTNQTIKFIAENTEPVKFDDLTAKQYERQTAKEVISRLCGGVRSAYVNALLVANKLDRLSTDELLGDKARTLVWPSCLYVQTFPDGLKTKVKEGDTASDIYTRLTGGGGSYAALRRYFKMDPAALDKLRPEQVLVASHATSPVLFKPQGMDVDAFRLALARTTDISSEMLVAVLREVEPPGGEIVLGIPSPLPTAATEVGITGALATAPGVLCRKPSAPAFDAAAVATAYRYAMKRRLSLERPVSAGRADIVVVDNGFFGADPRTHPSKPFQGSPFSKAFFLSVPGTTISEKIDFEKGPSRPINFEHDLTPSVVSGHGTHVTGIVLGGPAFKVFLDAWEAEHEPWATISVFNVAKGERQMIRGSAFVLQSMLGNRGRKRIVNLSLAHDGNADRDVASIYERLFREAPDNLFVVAAGNGSRDVSKERVYPAAYGGVTKDNVVTVAALDGDGSLAPFSNWGSRATDLAAPGCAIPSWTSNTHDLVHLSGTSQAAPLVTFVAGLLRSLNSDSSSRAIKDRLIASGDLLEHPEDSDKIAFRVRLNPAKALLWFDDYLVVAGESAGEYLGEIKAIDGMRCIGELPGTGDPAIDLLAFKRSGSTAYVYNGRSASRVSQPCHLANDASGRVTFLATHRITSSGIQFLEQPKEIKPALHHVLDLVVKTELNRN